MSISTVPSSSTPSTSYRPQGAIANFGLLEAGKGANALGQAIAWREPVQMGMSGMFHNVFHPSAFFASAKSLFGTVFKAGWISGLVDGGLSLIYNGYLAATGKESAGKAVREVAFDTASGVGGGMGAALFSGVGATLLGTMLGGPLLFLGATAFGIAGYLLGSSVVRSTLYQIWDHFTTKSTSTVPASSSSSSTAPTSSTPIVASPSSSSSGSASSLPAPTLYQGPVGTTA